MKDDLISEEAVVRIIMRELKLGKAEARTWLEHAIHIGLITPEDMTEAERPHWKCWKNLS
jgi:hypothetical protein